MKLRKCSIEKDTIAAFANSVSEVTQIPEILWLPKQIKEKLKEVDQNGNAPRIEVMPNLTGPVADGRDGIISLFVSFSELIIQEKLKEVDQNVMLSCALVLESIDLCYGMMVDDIVISGLFLTNLEEFLPYVNIVLLSDHEAFDHHVTYDTKTKKMKLCLHSCTDHEASDYHVTCYWLG
ncbi:unnamed protein product [Lactuca saligna]|uniref:Uncharacterized protein n=1 Tax=Lactuca saligna TaxID=75948 RepID=A0AA35Z977_LACSI|nr:unnamed protein product [Lactuca saligna]